MSEPGKIHIYEKYTLTLTHDIVDGNGESRMEEPIRVAYCIDQTPMGCTPVIVNEMLRKLSAYLLVELQRGTQG